MRKHNRNHFNRIYNHMPWQPWKYVKSGRISRKRLRVFDGFLPGSFRSIFLLNYYILIINRDADKKRLVSSHPSIISVLRESLYLIQ